jgi:hypothetical protein
MGAVDKRFGAAGHLIKVEQQIAVGNDAGCCVVGIVTIKIVVQSRSEEEFVCVDATFCIKDWLPGDEMFQETSYLACVVLFSCSAE